MILPISVVAGILLGLASGGKLKRLADFHLSWYGLLVASALLQMAIGYGLVAGRTVIGVTYSISVFLVFLTCMRNFGRPGLVLIGLGVLLNLVVIAANGGQMPVGVARADYWKGTNYRQSQGRTHTPSSDETKLGILGDVIIVRLWSGADVLSLGDLAIGIGTVVASISAVRLTPTS